MNEQISKYDEDFFNFLEGAFIAINQLDEIAATKLLAACEVLRPEHSLIWIGKGYLHLHKLELSNAMQWFEKVLKKDPDNVLAKTFLGIAKTLTPDQVTEGEKILEDTKKHSDDPSVQKVANTSLEFVEKFVKNPKNMFTP